MKIVRFGILVLCIMAAIMCILSGCEKNEVELDNLSIEYSETDTYINKGGNLYESINDYFAQKTNKGFIGKIVPSEYTFFYNVSCDEDTGRIYIDGYAECKCSIELISHKYNNSEYKEGDNIIIRQNIYLEPLNDDAILKMFKDIGAYENDKFIVGLFKANNDYINENDYRLLISESTMVLSEEQNYYAYVTIENEIPYFSLIATQKDETTQSIPDEVLLSMSNFKNFLQANDDIFD